MSKWSFVRQGLGAAFISAIAIGGVLAAAGAVKAADLSTAPPQRHVVAACPPGETVILFDDKGRPTVPARTPYFYCVTGTVLLPGDIPPPPQYCCG